MNRLPLVVVQFWPHSVLPTVLKIVVAAAVVVVVAAVGQVVSVPDVLVVDGHRMDVAPPVGNQPGPYDLPVLLLAAAAVMVAVALVSLAAAVVVMGPVSLAAAVVMMVVVVVGDLAEVGPVLEDALAGAVVWEPLEPAVMVVDGLLSNG